MEENDLTLVRYLESSIGILSKERNTPLLSQVMPEADPLWQRVRNKKLFGESVQDSLFTYTVVNYDASYPGRQNKS